MEIEIAEWWPDIWKQNDKVVGKVRVMLNHKMFIWMAVLRSKNGKCFCKFPNIKHQDKFIPAIGWPDNAKMERTISDTVIKKLEDSNNI